MIEVLKQAYQLLLTEPHAPTVCDQLEVIFRRAIAELESQEPVAWIALQKEAQQIVESKVFYRKFIDGTPLVNDIACWMADFALQQYAHPPQLEQNYCPRCGKRTNDIHTCTPPQRTEQEPVKLPCCGYTDASAVKWNLFNRVVQCHNCGQTYTQPQRTWVGLTDEDAEEVWQSVQASDFHDCVKPFAQGIEAKLKEKNT